MAGTGATVPFSSSLASSWKRACAWQGRPHKGVRVFDQVAEIGGGSGPEPCIPDMDSAGINRHEGPRQPGRQVLVEEQLHSGGAEMSFHSRSTAKARQARMSKCLQ